MVRKGMILGSLLLALSVMLVILGCDVHQGNADSDSLGKKGGAVFVLEWPTGRTLLANAVQSVRIEVSTDDVLLDSRICNRPTSGGTAIVAFGQLPAGKLWYTMQAFSQPEGAGVLLGSASSRLLVAGGKDSSIAMDIKLDGLVETITMDDPTDPLQAGSSNVLIADTKNSSGKSIMASLHWSSDNTYVATVDEYGVVTGHNAGIARITVRENISGKAVTVIVAVIPHKDDITITITPSDPYVEVNKSITLAAMAGDDRGTRITEDTYVWSSSDEGIATVNQHGKVTGVSEGTAIIMATDDIYGLTQVVTVIVTPAPGYAGKIVFQSNRTGSEQIFVVNADGTGLRQVTTMAGPNESPVFDPTGTQIAFTSGSVGGRVIYLMDTDGGNLRYVTQVGSEADCPCFSPDGRQIAYASNITGSWEIYLYDIDTTERIQLTFDTYEDSHPSFSPDGQSIAFSSTRTGNSDIYIMNIDGSDIRRLTTSTAWDGMPVFNTNGMKIAFMSNRGGGSVYQTYVMNPDGSGQTPVLNTGYSSRTPSFYLDGTKVVYAANPANQFDIYISNLDGSGLTLVAGGSGRDWHPCWAP